MISYDELLSYFQSANSQLRERFTHLFVEHTFIGTPVCEHCKGMVSHSVRAWRSCHDGVYQMKGIVKQGVRCKDCGISCHKHCKDHVVVDCSKRKEKKSRLMTSYKSVFIIPDYRSQGSWSTFSQLFQWPCIRVILWWWHIPQGEVNPCWSSKRHHP